MNSKILFLILFITVNFQVKVYAQGNLLITPTRLVFEENNIKEVINLVNSGNEIETYVVSFVERRMNEDGTFTVVTEPDPDQNFAKPYLRIYPRTVTLAPGEGQVVMLQRIRDRNLQTGEYRSHLYFRSTTDYTALGQTLNDSITGVSVNLTPIYGLTIPVIFNTGKVTSTVTLSDLKLESQKDINLINFTINRAGNSSVYGDFTVEYLPLKGEPITIGVIKGVAVYTTINRRFMSINVIKPPLINFIEGSLKITYKSRPEAKKTTVFAESTLKL
ncbi:hypothetical protein BST83_05935 [Polaribacter filamentus]|uniref:Molecular chaperone n=1 Tax=Polaribacter filamentus TaxID=53483 RepID=A0A2S7KVS6_9FLAO|nr:hypothetical protein [Polaribacter filamentus]PQB06745.1 hypothetical protein BST83_05935 [Polaribacter filamentus]